MTATVSTWVASLLLAQAEFPSDRGFAISEPVACRVIRGYEDYEPLAEPVIPRTEKLLIYVRSEGHQYERQADGYRFHLVQDVNIRRQGEKKILWGRKRVVDYEGTSPRPPLQLYLSTTLGLVDLPPGTYEADLIVHDRIGGGEPARRTLTFRLTDPPPTPPRSDRITDSTRPTPASKR
ncbi:MAG: hypothetical protein KatS3mg108_1781 [Isosphaeraceae bacterium]|jgi:hypothetical protein|nr:MAG: hypothetical protein KatS3mg108_1781 [Isosphaeraceae bacterium]